jgi:hypothetical protein
MSSTVGAPNAATRMPPSAGPRISVTCSAPPKTAEIFETRRSSVP